MHEQDEKQECFLKQEFDEVQSNFLSSPLNINILVNVHKNIPGNELRSIKRPERMKPRTFFDNKNVFLLPEVLNQPYQQISIPSKAGVNRIKIANRERLSIDEFFSKKQFKLVYSKEDSFSAEKKNFMGKLKTIDSVSDYNHKLFKEIQEEISISTERETDQIDSNFECGNLYRAYTEKSESKAFYCLIENDLNTYGYNIWFFFRLKTCNRKGVYVLHLVNLIKKTDNYKKGMQVSIFSKKKYENEGIGWYKSGDKVSFGETNFFRHSHNSQKYYYLSFEYESQYENDQIFFSLNQPYSYSRMINHIQSMSQKKARKSIHIEIKVIGHSLTDNVIPAVKITESDSNSGEKECQKSQSGISAQTKQVSLEPQPKQKETILVTARQHPSETVGSFVCEGIMDYLVGESPEAKSLLSKFQVIVIPMVNPDGVIHGSSRCNVAGFDLNRQWGSYLMKQFTPQTHKIKKYVTSLHKNNPIKYFFDLHGHGKKLNSFFFSCKKSDKPSHRLMELSMNKLEPRFNILDCTYGIDRYKENTIRSQFFNGLSNNQKLSLDITNSYTLENSLFGFQSGQGTVQPYSESDLKHIGCSLLQGIFVMENRSQKVKEVLGFTTEELLQNSAAMIARISEKEKEQSKSAIFENASDSDPDGDILDINERIETCFKDNPKLKSKLKENVKLTNPKSKKHSNRRKVSTATDFDFYDVSNSQKSINDLSEENKKMSKMSLSKKRTIYNKKNRSAKPNQDEDNFIRDSFLKKNESLREKLAKTEMGSLSKGNLSKKRESSSSVIFNAPEFLDRKGKESKRIQTQQASQQEIPGVFYEGQEQIKKQAKFKSLKQQSLKALLTDTFSVLKIKPKLSVKRYIKSNPYQKQRKSSLVSSQNSKKEALDSSCLSVTSQKRSKTFHSESSVTSKEHVQKNKGKCLSTRKASVNDGKQKILKYKRFQNFLKSEISSRSGEKQNRPVFYYFPVL